ncbi:MAG: cbb3-type cytochrome oxidase assembly protein CcoS [Candidatus Berkiella sp.]
MMMIYVLIPISILLLFISYWFFKWAVKKEQYEDLESPAHQILFDDKAHKKALSSFPDE